MGKLVLEERVRYPPFEPYRFKAELLPIGTNKIEIDNNLSEQDALRKIKDLAPPFRIGNNESWLIERRYLFDNKVIKLDGNYNQTMEEGFPKNSIVDKQRTGWYLTPNSIHASARKIMNYSVIILLLSLTYLFSQPILSLLGIPDIGTERIRIGLLDYPLLAIIVTPILFVPIFMRIGANFFDLLKQRKFLSSPPKSPLIKFHSNTTSGENLVVEIDFPEENENWGKKSVLWRVGVLPPRRDFLMKVLGRGVDEQPAPGLTTELPHHWSVDLDDGTGGGEDSPMQTSEAKGGLFLKPMRIMQQSRVVEISDSVVTIPNPQGNWPGTIFSSLIRIHWELIIIINRNEGSDLLWVQPLKVHNSSFYTENEAVVNSGRTETNQPLSSNLSPG